MPSATHPVAPLQLFARALRALGQAAVGSCLDLTGELRCASCDDPLTRAALLCAPCADTVLRVAGVQGRMEQPTFAYAYHGGALAEAIRRFKYRRRPDLGKPLAELLLQALPPVGQRSSPWSLVAPVPLHPRRLVARGYNQAALLAAPLARRLGAHHAPDLLIRSIDTPPQARLAGAARRRNLLGAFSARRHPRIARQRILLVDDVTTTGATLAASRAALLAAGADRVDAVVLTRSDRGDGARAAEATAAAGRRA